MRALCLTAPRQFAWADQPTPHAPGPDEARVAVRSIGICGTDFSGYLGKMPFIQYPRILGHELGVEILETGPGVTHLRHGQRCAVQPYLACGTCHPCQTGRTNCCEHLQVLGVHRDGGMCQELVLSTRLLHPSSTLSFDELALVEPLAIGCHAVQRSALRETESALVIGAGPIGLATLAFARLRSPRVTVVELNPARRALVASLFPTIPIVESHTDTTPADVVFDATGHPAAMAAAFSLARFGGRVVYVGITSQPVPLDDPLFHRRELTLLASRNALTADFPRIIALIESGSLDARSWITHQIPWQDFPAAIDTWLQPDSGILKGVIHL